MTIINVVPFRDYGWNLSRVRPFLFNLVVVDLVAGFYGVVMWMGIKLKFQTYVTFKSHQSLYFWPILVTAWGIELHALGFLLKLFAPSCPRLLSIIISNIGWICNVTGFAIVLYSRPHLVVCNRLILRLVLAMIITDVFILHVPLTTTKFGLWFTSKTSPTQPMWLPVFQVIERIQITRFILQEKNIISSIYIYQMWRSLKSGYDQQTRNVILLFIATQAVALTFDLCLVILNYVDMFYLKATIHPFAYAVKLRLEFIILNELLNLIRHGIVPGNFIVPNDDDTLDAEFPAGSRIRNTIFSDKKAHRDQSTIATSGEPCSMPNTG